MKALRSSNLLFTRHCLSSHSTTRVSIDPQPAHLLTQQTRTFLPNFNPFAAPTHTQKISVSRTLPYPSRALYSIIADVSQYSRFVPFCQRSIVTRWSSDDSTGEKWPEEATLTVGWRDIQEKFQSRVYCVPGKVVEALSGTSRTSLDPEEIKHHDLNTGNLKEAGEGPFDSLRTRWSVHGTETEGKTDVRLAIEYKFTNPIYNALSAAAEDKIAQMMIEAFEKRVEEVLGTRKL